MRLLFILLFITSCSHMSGGYHHDHESHKKNYVNYEEDDKHLKIDHKEAMELFDWALKELKEHQKAISIHEKKIAKYKAEHEEFLKEGKSLEAKKVKLQMSRLHAEMAEAHKHRMHDHKEMMEIVEDLSKLKKEMESHEGHHH